MNNLNHKSGSIKRMTEGEELKLLLHFMIPLLMGNIFQQLYTMVDSIVVGHYVSDIALGSVGSVSSVSFLFLSLCIGMAGGINILTAQNYGARNEKRLKQVIGNSVYITTVIGLLMSIAAIVLARPILYLIQVPTENFADALVYMRIVCGAAFITAIYNAGAQILQALGDSKTSLYVVILSSMVNIALDLFFVIGLHMGVVGVAIATVMAQLVAAVGVIIISIKRNPILRLTKEDIRYSPEIIKKILRIGIPLTIQNAMASINGVISQGIVNSFGSTIMSAYTACGRVEQILAQPYGSLGVAIANFTGQNIGAGTTKRVKVACKKALFLLEGFTVCVIAICMFGGKTLIGLFLTDESTILIGYQGLRIVSFAYLFASVVYTYKAMLNGAGDTTFSMVNGIIEIIARIFFLFSLVLIPAVGYWGIWLSAIPSGIVSAGMCIWRYRSGRWKRSSSKSKE